MIISFAIWFFKYYLPAMVANASPLLINGSKPIDFSKKFVDNKPILGPHKTWEGLVIALHMGLTISLAISIVLEEQSFILLGFGGATSAVMGDLVGSFIKRRFGVKSGDPFPILDQLDFFIFSSLFYALADTSFLDNPYFLLFAILIIIVLHVATNNIAYILGLKKVRF